MARKGIVSLQSGSKGIFCKIRGEKTGERQEGIKKVFDFDGNGSGTDAGKL